VKSVVVYRICKDPRQIMPIWSLRERRQHERGSNTADLTRLAKRLCGDAITLSSYVIVISEDNTSSTEARINPA
jgi:hypothetical protein